MQTVPHFHLLISPHYTILNLFSPIYYLVKRCRRNKEIKASFPLYTGPINNLKRWERYLLQIDGRATTVWESVTIAANASIRNIAIGCAKITLSGVIASFPYDPFYVGPCSLVPNIVFCLLMDFLLFGFVLVFKIRLFVFKCLRARCPCLPVGPTPPSRHTWVWLTSGFEKPSKNIRLHF